MNNGSSEKKRHISDRMIMAVVLVLVVIAHILVIWWMEKSKTSLLNTAPADPLNVAVSEREKPDNINPDQKTGEKLLNEGRNEEALKIFNRILEKSPEDARALEGKSQALMNLGRWEEAMPAVKALLKIEPQNIDALLNRSRIYLERGDMENYVLDRRTAQKIKPRMARTNIELGRALSWVGRGPESLEYLEKAMKLSPTRPEKAAILTSAAYAHKLMKNPAKAEELLKESLKLNVTDCDNEIQCYFMLAGVYIDQDRDEEALKMIEKYQKADPGFRLARHMGKEIIATHYRNLGSLSLYRNNPDASIRYFTKSIELEPDNRQGLLERALVYYLSGQIAKARKDVESWKKTNPPPPEDSGEYESYATAHLIAGDGKKALEYINSAIEKDSDNYRLLGTRALIFHQLKDRRRYREDLKAFLNKADKNEKETVRMLMRRMEVKND